MTEHLTDTTVMKPSAGPLLIPVLADLAEVVGAVRPDQLNAPTPCAEYDVGALRTHVLGWLSFFAAAVEDPTGEAPRPDPEKATVPDDAAAAADQVREDAARIAAAVRSGVAGKPVAIIGMTLPGEQALSMMLMEYLAHGSDLATAIGRPWAPAPEAAELGLAAARGMLSDEYRGPGKSFGHAVAVPDDAPALDRLLGFSGRNPYWTA
jgi:uncharacterized protein (TIGR03086 family)